MALLFNPTLEEMKEAFLVIYKLRYDPKDIIITIGK